MFLFPLKSFNTRAQSLRGNEIAHFPPVKLVFDCPVPYALNLSLVLVFVPRIFSGLSCFPLWHWLNSTVSAI